MGLADRHYMYESSSGHGFRFEKNVVIMLIAVNVGAFVLNMLTPNSNFWLYNVALSSHGIKNFRLWQFVSYMFLHGNIMHILFNMWGLYLFGMIILPIMGARRFVTLYFLSGVSGAGFWLLLNWNSRVPIIGASGAVFGVMMAAAMLNPHVRIQLLFPPIPMQLKTFVTVYAALEILFELSNSQRGVAHLAHLGGVFSAYVYMKAVYGHQVWDIFSPLRKFVKKRPSKKSEKGMPPSRGKLPDGWTVYSNPTFYQSPVPKEEIDRLLDKISETGMTSLTEEELDTLKRASGEMKH